MIYVRRINIPALRELFVALALLAQFLLDW